MEKSTSENIEDNGNMASTHSESGSAEKFNGRSAVEDIIREGVKDDNLVCSVVENANSSTSDELSHLDIDIVDSSKFVEEDLPKSTSTENPSIIEKRLTEFEVDDNYVCPEEDTHTEDLVPTKSVTEDHHEDSGDKIGDNLDKTPSDNENVLTLPCETVVPCGIDEIVNAEGSKTSEVVELGEDKNSEVIELEEGSNSVIESDNSYLTKSNEVSEEKNGQPLTETEVDATLEEPEIQTNSEQNETVSEELELAEVDPIAVDIKSRKRGRSKRYSQQLDQNFTENGTVDHEDDEADDLTAGRPRRKAAKKAGDQIRQMVGNEEDVTELVYDKREGSEEWTSGAGCPPRKICFQCCRLRSCQYHLLVNGISRYMCTTPCFQAFRKQHPSKSHVGKITKELDPKGNEIVAPPVDARDVRDARPAAEGRPRETKEHVLECAFCHLVVLPPTASEKSLSWETMEFCNEDCLGKYQDQLGSNCSQCKVPVQRISMGKYCVRFGYNIKQFCCSTCLEEFKKGLKACTYCQKDISTGAEGFLAPVGDKGQFKDFCSSACMEQYDHISSGTRPPAKEAACAVCDKFRFVFVEVVTRRVTKEPLEGCATKTSATIYSLCSEPCFAAFQFVNQVKTEQCESCLRYFDTSKPEEKPATFFHDGGYHCCCRACLNIFILTRRSIVQCNWCRVKKYDFDMIKRISSSGQVLMMCSLNCLSLYHVSISAVSSRRVSCDFCNEVSQAQYHLTMSDATVRNFCSYDCVMTFQSQYSKTPLTLPEDDSALSLQTPVPGLSSQQVSSQKSQPLTVQSGPIPVLREDDTSMPPIPVISSVQSLATVDRSAPKEVVCTPVSISSVQQGINLSLSSGNKCVGQNNGMALRQIIVKPPTIRPVKNKGTSCKPLVASKSVECKPSTVDGSCQTEEFLPRGPILIPVPVPIYVPMPMHMYSSPFPVPVPFPLPIPVPIVIPAKVSVEDILKKSKEIPEIAPEQAEILMMAELVVADEEQKEVDKISKSEEGLLSIEDSEVGCDSDAEDRENLPAIIPSPDPSIDLESSIILSTVPGPAYIEGELSVDEQQDGEKGQGHKRKANERGRISKAKRLKTSHSQQSEEEEERNELKASLGVSAWQLWVQQKNSELSKVTSNSRRLKLFKTELLLMTLEELNYALCLFVKEVRKPGGGMYAPDTILYFCLGIQHYLMENGRLDNIFTDLYFEKFTECLDQVAKTFPPLTKETRLISTRVEEEHLWESRQLGAHSPYVLLSTLVFFNTKYFRLWTVEDHAKLTFTNVVKVWRKTRGRPPESTKAGSSANHPSSPISLLRYVHPDKLLDEDFLQRRVYEQHENTTTPLRCPVKLYEFYLSKCPDPIKKCGEVFYLLPERACVPDSPVWYSGVALGSDALGKILHRIQMVKEVNKAYVNELSQELPAVKSLSEASKEKPVDDKKNV